VGERILAMEERPTGVVLVDNTMAIGLYHIFQEAKIVPGKDISIVGFDESPNGEFLRPSLTQFEVPLGQLGRWLGEHIVLLIEAKAAAKKIPQFAKTWPMKMILGDSSGPAT
jgi:DNA-binding LacI/PurR family transcriptional regulator